MFHQHDLIREKLPPVSQQEARARLVAMEQLDNVRALLARLHRRKEQLEMEQRGLVAKHHLLLERLSQVPERN